VSETDLAAQRPAALDHLVYAVPDLEQAVAEFARRTGVIPVPGGRHVGRGTANYLVGLGGAAYLELIGPDPAAGEHRAQFAMPFGVGALTAPVLRTWAIATTAIDTQVQVARERGYDPGEAAPMSRRAPDGDLLEWRLTTETTSDGGGLVPFLIDWGHTVHPTHLGLPEVALISLRASSPIPSVIRSRLSALGCDLEVDYADKPQLEAVVLSGNGELRLH
jgi:hypothetical protein